MTEAQSKANKYLMEIRNARSDINEMIQQIEYLRYKASGATAIRYDKDHVQTSPEDMVCEAISEAITIENKLYHYHSKILDMREHTQKVISIWNNKNAEFIKSYYLSHDSMSATSRRIGCSDRNAYYIKMKALEEFSKYI